MKNANYIIQGILALAIAGLYYLHFKGKTTGSEEKEVKTVTLSDTTVTIPDVQPSEVKSSRIVYINGDSLFANYAKVKDMSKSIEAKQRNLENQLQTKGQKFQQDYIALSQQAQQGLIKADEAQRKEQELMARKAELDNLQLELDKLASDAQKKNADLRKEIEAFLKNYNKNGYYQFILAYTSMGENLLYAADSLDITKDVLQGLNNAYKKK